MSNLNYVIFEEYKHLDKLCGELYHDQHGISCYINDMKKVSENDCRYIPGWNDDLKRLIHLRHIRNYLAHTEGAFNEEVCTQKDIEWSQEFHKRILNQSDPLAMLYQYFNAKQQIGKTIVSSRRQPPLSSPQANPNEPKNRKRLCLYWIIISLVIAGILFLAILKVTELLGYTLFSRL